MPDILKPNAKAVLWAAIGFLVVPRVWAAVSSRMGR